jgi:hypothetical protein
VGKDSGRQADTTGWQIGRLVGTCNKAALVDWIDYVYVYDAMIQCFVLSSQDQTNGQNSHDVCDVVIGRLAKDEKMREKEQKKKK